MELEKKEYDGARNVWLVFAKGESPDGNFPDSLLIYAGARDDLAMRTAMEAMMLSNVFRYGRGSRDPWFSYAAMFGGRRSHECDGAEPFSWAMKPGWMFDDDGVEYTIEGADVRWVDENGAETDVETVLSSLDKEILSRVPTRQVHPPGGRVAGDGIGGEIMSLLEEWVLATGRDPSSVSNRKSQVPGL